MTTKPDTNKIRRYSDEELLHQARKPFYMLLAIFISVIVALLWFAIMCRYMSGYIAWLPAIILAALTLTWHNWAINKLRQ